MLGLAQKIDGDPVGIIVGICNHKDLRRTCNHINADLAEDPSFCSRDPGVTRPGDLVHRADRLRSIGQRRNSLRATQTIYRLDTRKPRSEENERIYLPIRCRRRHHQSFDAGNLGRNCVHQTRRRITCKTARHVQSCCRDSRPAPPKACTRLVRPADVFRQLALVIGLNPFRRQFQRHTFRFGDFGDGQVDFVFRKGEGFRRQVETIEFGGQLDKCRVPTRPHIRDDLGHGFIDIRRILSLQRQ